MAIEPQRTTSVEARRWDSLDALRGISAFLVVTFHCAQVPIGFAAAFFAAVVYNVAQISYRQAICPPRLMGRMNAAVRWIVWGTMPVGALIGGALGTAIGVRPTLWIGLIGSWAAGFWVYFSPLRRMRDVPQAQEPEPTAALA